MVIGLTYTIAGERGSGSFVSTAPLPARVGDKIIIMSYCQLEAQELQQITKNASFCRRSK